jgi:outer membrane lipase/esterase
MSGALGAALAGEVGVTTFDLSGTFSGVFANPSAYGLSNVTDACLFGQCDASKYLFWDGIHPTARGHEILAQAMYAQVVPEPETYALFALGLAALAWRARKRVS